MLVFLASDTARYKDYKEKKMSKDTIEIRWHGRGGQGAKTACLLLADVAFTSGKQVQGFPEYGPERMGAPITAYNRISDSKISLHCNIYNPDFVAVVDETLLHTVDVTAGLSQSGAVIINTPKTPEEVRPLLNGYKGKVCTVDAAEISMHTLGKNFPNSPMLAAVVKVSQVVDKELFIKNMRGEFEHKFATKSNVVEGNMNAIMLAMNQVKEG